MSVYVCQATGPGVPRAGSGRDAAADGSQDWGHYVCGDKEARVAEASK